MSRFLSHGGRVPPQALPSSMRLVGRCAHIGQTDLRPSAWTKSRSSADVVEPSHVGVLGVDDAFDLGEASCAVCSATRGIEHVGPVRCGDPSASRFRDLPLPQKVIWRRLLCVDERDVRHDASLT
jgi:hypothetical protein